MLAFARLALPDHILIDFFIAIQIIEVGIFVLFRIFENSKANRQLFYLFLQLSDLNIVCLDGNILFSDFCLQIIYLLAVISCIFYPLLNFFQKSGDFVFLIVFMILNLFEFRVIEADSRISVEIEAGHIYRKNLL